MDARDKLSAGPQELIVDAKLSLNNPDNPSHKAGMTFLGQFLDHDMTLDATSNLERQVNPKPSGIFGDRSSNWTAFTVWDQPRRRIYTTRQLISN